VSIPPKNGVKVSWDDDIPFPIWKVIIHSMVPVSTNQLNIPMVFLWFPYGFPICVRYFDARNAPAGPDPTSRFDRPCPVPREARCK